MRHFAGQVEHYFWRGDTAVQTAAALFVAEQTFQFCACIVILGGWQRGCLVIVQVLILCFVIHFSVIRPAINQGLFLGFDTVADVNETTSFSPL